MNIQLIKNFHDFFRYIGDFSGTDEQIIFPCIAITKRVYDEGLQTQRMIRIYIDNNNKIYYYKTGASKTKIISKNKMVELIHCYGIATMSEIERECAKNLLI